ncbi:flippase activity-associated protein Agl23 [Halorussus halobius]|uniref:flippase activity-associated protein Agl23 n=1 Tax=Halorussus halobius TaxID=1710537 RepID=UPI0010928032|nr:flippase activity-associated protein Agl23 [Halorussus halobius]
MTADESRTNARRRARESVTGLGRSVGTRTAAALLAVTVLALSLRLFALGTRVFHWDEARVGYWILRYGETGVWEYHAVIHGPFFYHVNNYLFGLFGASDFLARVPVAVVSGLLPLTAWLFRERLRRVEMVVLGLLLAANPVVLYYSRFMRNDVLLAAFMLFALGFYVRLFDTRKPRYLYAGTIALALAFTTKENVLVYVVTWLGAVVLLADHRLQLLAGGDDRRALVREWVGDAWRSLWDDRWALHLLLGVVTFFAVIVFFYAPRAQGVPGPGLWKAFSDPGLFPAVIEDATIGSWEEAMGKWGEGNQGSYVESFLQLGSFLWAGAAAVVVLAPVGFLADRYADRRPRDVVSFTFYWGFVTVLGYPAIVENDFPWEVVHAVVPLAVPAAVGVALLVRWGAAAVTDGDGVSAALAALLVLLVAGQVAATAVSTTYAHPQDQYLDDAGQEENLLVQYGQPAEGIRPTLETVQAASEANDGIDVLYYGSDFYVADESDADDWSAPGGWYDRLPIPWYTELAGAEVDSTTDLGVVGSDSPPVVVARAEDAEAVGQRLGDYRAFEEELTIYGSETVFFVDEEYVDREAVADE